MTKKITVGSFYRPFTSSGYMCSGCKVIIDLSTPGEARLCTDCKSKPFQQLFKKRESK